MIRLVCIIFAMTLLVSCTFKNESIVNERVQDARTEKREVMNETVSQLPQIVTESEKEQLVQKGPVETVISAGGDIMLSRWVGVKIDRSGDTKTAFHNIAETFENADIAFANLESPFNDVGPMITEGMIFKAEPEFVDGLVFSGFDVLSLANNHFGNQQRAGMEFTFEHLTNNGIGYCGAGVNAAKAHTPLLVERNEIVFGFLCYNGISPASAEAGSDYAGHAWARPEEVVEDVAKAKEVADVVIVSMHHGTEYTPIPNAAQVEFAHAAIDAGAETVIGHHPHVVQHVEKYQGKLIAYSLGNLIFDQMWSQETREGVIAHYTFKDKVLEKIDFDVVIIDDYHKPRFASENEARPVLQRMKLDSSTFQ